MQGEIDVRLTNRALFLVLGAGVLIWLLFNATHIVVVLFIAVLLATAISAAANRLERYRVPRSLAILAHLSAGPGDTYWCGGAAGAADRE